MMWWKKKSRVCFENIRSVRPISKVFGFDRGTPIDRYYIKRFLETSSADIQGHVLEIGAAEYTRQFGSNRVTQSDVLHAMPGNPEATLIGDLATGKGIPKDRFDCMILTQTLSCIYDVPSAIANCYKALKPLGIVLATVPGISQISRYDMDRWGDYWRLTTLSAKKLFGDVFGAEHIQVKAYGNVWAAVAFLHGLACEELTPEELEFCDPDYDLLISIRAAKTVR